MGALFVFAFGSAFVSTSKSRHVLVSSLNDITVYDKDNNCTAVTCGAYSAPNPLCTIYFDDSPGCSTAHVGTERKKP